MKIARKISKIFNARRQLFRVNYKPIVRVFRHTNGAATLALGKYRLKVWGWWK